MLATQLNPVYIDPHAGFIYFLVLNNGQRTISNLFGTVYGAGSVARRGAYLINNPNTDGIKVSIGAHISGSVAMYRFVVAPDNMDFPYIA